MEKWGAGAYWGQAGANRGTNTPQDILELRDQAMGGLDFVQILET